MNRKDDGNLVVKLANPKSLEYQVVRTSLLPGLLKTIRENKAHALPIKVFETSDVVVKDPSAERQTRNIRHAAAIWCNKTAGFEVVHGLLDRMMAMLEVPRIPKEEKEKAMFGYYLEEIEGACRLGHLTVSADDSSRPNLLPWPCREDRVSIRVEGRGDRAWNARDSASKRAREF